MGTKYIERERMLTRPRFKQTKKNFLLFTPTFHAFLIIIIIIILIYSLPSYVQRPSMDSPFDILLHNWMLSLSSLEKISFRRYGIDSLFSLRGVKIEWDFLRAAACFWDPIDHVFRFNMEELCPTHE